MMIREAGRRWSLLLALLVVVVVVVARQGEEEAFSCQSVLIKLPDLLTESSTSSSLFGESSVDGDTDELSTMASASIKHSSISFRGEGESWPCDNP